MKKKCVSVNATLIDSVESLMGVRRSVTNLIKMLDKHHENGQSEKLGEVQEKINAAMNDIALVIGLDVLDRMEDTDRSLVVNSVK